MPRSLFLSAADYGKMYRVSPDLSDATVSNILLTIILLWLYFRIRPICKFIGMGDELKKAQSSTRREPVSVKAAKAPDTL